MKQEQFRADSDIIARLLILAALVLTIAWLSQAFPARAAGTLYFSATTAPADGLTTITAIYGGDTTGTGDTVGNQVRFSVAPAPGSSAVPKLTDGTTSMTVSLTGAPCDGVQHAPSGTVGTTCYAPVQFTSTVAGAVLVTAQNLTSGAAPVSATRSFYGAPVSQATDGTAQSGPLRVAGVGDLSATVARRVGTTGAFSGGLTVGTPIRDAGGRAVAAAPVTCVTTMGAFAETNNLAISGVTTADGQLPSMTLTLTALQVSNPAPGTISCTISAVTGSLTITGLFATVGAPATMTLTTDKPTVSGVTGTNDTVVITITVKDTAGNGVTALETGGLTVAATPATAGAVGTLAPSASTPGSYTATYTPITSVAGNGADAVSITARLTTGASLTQTATIVQSAAPATMTLVASVATVAPGGFALLTATLKDSAGRTVATAGAPSVAFTSTGSGNTLVPSSAFQATNGVATGVFIAGNTVGPVTVTVSTANGLGAFRVLTISAAASSPTTATQQTITVTSTGVFCFKYEGPTKAAADLTTFLATNVVSVNQMNFPAGNYSSWFRAAPSLATLNQISNGDVLCVSGPIGQAVFATS